MRCITIIPASGTGSRFESKIPKQFYKIEGDEILIHTLKKFECVSEITEIIIATKNIFFKKIENLLKKHSFSKKYKIVQGGKRRQDSVYSALKACECNENDIILVHDAVRPYLTVKLIKKLIRNAKKYKAVIPVLNIDDTIKKIKNNFVENTIPRSDLKRAQTPQAFEFGILFNAFRAAYENNIYATDESSIVENYGYPVSIIEGEEANIKITKKENIREYI